MTVDVKTPLSEGDARGLRVGDRVRLSGIIVTARDAGHRYLAEGGVAPVDLNVIYHCGPIVKDGRIISAGPTTSMREEPYMADVIGKFGVRAVIGKGGMGDKTLKALGEHGCVYLTAVGGAGVAMAEAVKEVKLTHMLEEFGAPEAFRVLEVEDMPLLVTMDSHGGSLYRDVEGESRNNLKKILNSL
jgi:tartrate/fumarate subfamily iron-sulfur-dependent hydro-lyase beta chain